MWRDLGRCPQYLLVITAFLLGAVAWSGAANAQTKFPAAGGPGDRTDELICPAGHVLSGLYGRTGAVIDQVGLICSPLQADFTTGPGIKLAARGGGGGGPGETSCDANGGVRAINFTVAYSENLASISGSKVMTIVLKCQKPRDGSDAGQYRRLGGDTGGLPGDGLFSTQHACPGSEYATGLTVRSGRHVNAIGLICAPAVAVSAPPKPAVSADMEIDVDRPGQDYLKFNTVGPEDCRRECLYQSDRCRSWTYVRPGVQGPRGICYLKGSVPAASSNACCISGVAPKITQLGKRRPAPASHELSTDRPGSDIHRFELDEANASICEARCTNLQRCRAWTYVKPGVQGAKAVCYLKDQTPQAVPNGCCTSGVKVRQE